MATKPTPALLTLLVFIVCLFSCRARVSGFTDGSFPTKSAPRGLLASPKIGDEPGRSAGDGGDGGFLSGMLPWSNESKKGFRNVPGSRGRMMDRPGVPVKPRPGFDTSSKPKKVSGEGVRKAKDAVYAVADGVKTTAEVVVAAPVKVVGGAVKAMSAIPEVVEETVETIQSVTGRVDETIQGVQKTAGRTTRFAKEVVDDVQHLPSTVRATIDETKRTLEETKRTTASLTKKVADAAYDVQAGLGWKPFRPKPPPPPPPPPTLDEQGGRAVRSTAEAATKLALFAGKGTLGLASATVKAAWGSAPKKNAEGSEAMQPDVDRGLEKEVTNALKMAEEALSAAEVDDKSKPIG